MEKEKKEFVSRDELKRRAGILDEQNEDDKELSEKEFVDRHIALPNWPISIKYLDVENAVISAIRADKIDFPNVPQRLQGADCIIFKVHGHKPEYWMSVGEIYNAGGEDVIVHYPDGKIGVNIDKLKITTKEGSFTAKIKK